ncbi:MAG: Intracellular proteinase inhibitor [Gemmatimonadetes bacterium]|nr:Intracellular proteinase inhibitor [Gemmatimonadota bacterium]
MNTRFAIPLLLTGALAFACGPRSHSSESAAAPVKKHRTTRDAQLSTNFDVRSQSNALRFTLAVANVGDRKMELEFPSGQTHEIVVTDSIGREVWRWGTSRMFTQAFQNKLLGGGESVEFDEQMKGTLKPGRYTAVATLASSNFPVEKRVEFIVR